MDNEQEIDIRQVIKMILKKKKILVYIMIVSLFLGVIYTFIINKPKYQSSTKALIDKNTLSIAEYINSNDIITEVATELNISNNHIKESITTDFDTKTLMITITASSISNEEAYKIVMKYSEVLKNKLEITYGVKAYIQIEQPQVSDVAYNIDHMKDLLMSLVVGIVICGVYSIFMINFSRDSIYSLIENNKITLLGKINKEDKEKTKVKSYISKNDKVITQMKKIMSNIELNKSISRPNSILVTGTNYGVGSTYVVSNLVMPYQRAGKKILIIDSNLKNGIEDKIFNIKNEIGLTDLIELKDITKEDVLKTIKQTKIKNIHILTKGNTEIEEEMLISSRISKIIDIVKNEYDIVLIDGEPISKKITAYGWANTVDATVIVAEYGKTKIDVIQETKKTIEEIGGKISGVVVNKAE